VGKHETRTRACGAIEQRGDGAGLPDRDVKFLRAAGFHLIWPAVFIGLRTWKVV
jgi:hypothetical protein